MMKQFFDGEYLAPEEIKFLINSSELLNSCIDKDFINKVINIVDKDIIQEVKR